MKLTEKQKRFCEEYLKTLNKTSACIVSGFQLQLTPCDKYFVYLLVDPRNDQIFYIGKGTKKRPYDHIAEAKRENVLNRFKTNRINEILASGYEVDIYYFAKGLEQSDAFKIEHELIKIIGTKNLTNISGGVRKATAREEAIHKLSTILPFDVWLQSRPNATEFEKELYWSVVDAYKKIAEHGYLYAVEQTLVNGIVETKEKWRI